MSMVGTRVAREQRVLLAVALNPLAFHEKEPSALEAHALARLRNRGLVDFFGGSVRVDWYTPGSEPWRVTITEAGWALLPERAHALIRLGAGR